MGDPATLTALRIDLRLQKALDIAVDNAKEISPEQAEARAKLWTPGEGIRGRGRKTVNDLDARLTASRPTS